MLLTAYVDESYDLTIGVYILTASIVDGADSAGVLAALHELRPRGGKLHWYESDAAHRLDLAKAVGALELEHMTVIGRGCGARTERARRKCMERLLPDLDGAGVDTVVLEARQQANNRHDINMVDACRRKKLISQGLHVTFALGHVQPLLWLADVACGSVLASQRGEHGYLEQFGEAARIEFVDVN